MRNFTFSNGVWPTMITPFTKDNKIDYTALEKMIQWYIDKNASGLFAVCQSSEMFFLSLEERIELAKFVKKKVDDKIQVIATGNVSSSIDMQIKEIKQMANTRVDAIVLLTSRLVKKDEPDIVLWDNVQRILKEVPKYIKFGLYECPYPYKRLVKPNIMKLLAQSERFYFLKDTSCDIENIKEKLKAVKGSKLKIFNANSTTLYESLKIGVKGFSGVMANFHPDLYAWICKNWENDAEKAKKISAFVSVASLMEKQLYPINAKYNMNLEGIKMNLHSRMSDSNEMSLIYKMEVNNLFEMTNEYRRKYKIV